MSLKGDGPHQMEIIAGDVNNATIHYFSTLYKTRTDQNIKDKKKQGKVQGQASSSAQQVPEELPSQTQAELSKKKASKVLNLGDSILSEFVEDVKSSSIVLGLIDASPIIHLWADCAEYMTHLAFAKIDIKTLKNYLSV